MSRGQLAWTIAAALHLVLVIAAASHVRFPSAVLAHYGSMTGADSSFGFFAPAVAAQSRATFTMRDAAGAEWKDVLVAVDQSVIAFRALSILDGVPMVTDRMRRGLTASWASAMFGRHPDAATVHVDIEIQVLPTMEEWRNGRPVTWAPVYKATFARGSLPARPREERDS